MAADRKHRQRRQIDAGTLAWGFLGAHVPRERLLLERVRLAWMIELPPAFAAHAHPAAVQERTLVVHVRNNQWLHELAYVRDELLTRVQRACPEAGIHTLRLRVGDLPAPSSQPPQPTHAAEPAAWSPQPSAATIAALDEIEDGDLRTVIAHARIALSRL